MIDLITGHQGVPHISAEQVSTINNVMMYGYGQDAIVRLKDGDISKDGLEILFSAGYWRANGYDVQITEDDSVILDPTSEGMSRIDVIYGEILQDIPSGVQRFELVVIQGEEAATPTEPPVPIEPQLTTDTLILAIPVAKCTVTESTMTILDQTLPLKGGAGSSAAYGTCSTSSSTSVKQVVTTGGDFALEPGNGVYVRFSFNNSVSTPQLQVDDCPTKNIFSWGDIWWKSNDVVLFVYDGIRFCMFPTSGQIETLEKGLSMYSIYGSTNNTGSTLVNGTFFFLDDVLCVAISTVLPNESFVRDTNYKICYGGLQYLFNELDKERKIIARYGTCSTAGSTSTKAVTTANGDFAMETGSRIYVKFSSRNTASSPSLKINSFAAKSIKAHDLTVPDIWWGDGDVVEFLYDGQYFIMMPSQGQITSATTGLTNISVPASSNNSGSTISKGTFFYQKGRLVRALANIAANATLTEGTNYEVVTAGGLNALNDALKDVTDSKNLGTSVDLTSYTASNQYTAPHDGYVKCEAAYVVSNTAILYVNDVNMVNIGGNGNHGQAVLIYVKKGMKLRGLVAGSATVTYISLSI